MGERTNLESAKGIQARLMIAHEQRLIHDQSDADIAQREIDVSAFALVVKDLGDDLPEFITWRAMRQVQLWCNTNAKSLSSLSNLGDLEQWAERMKPSHRILKVLESELQAEAAVDDHPRWTFLQQAVKDLLDEAEKE